MANTGIGGIDVRQTSSKLAFEALLVDYTGAILTTGTTTLKLYELQDDGTLKSFDFNDNTFKTTALTTETASMTHRQGNNSTSNTGIWSVIQSTLSGFTKGAIYIAYVSNTGASPAVQGTKFQFGSCEGDMTLSAQNNIKADVEDFGGTAGAFSGGLPDVNTKKISGTTQTARDIGLSVLLSSGTGTGQLDFTSGVVKANAVQLLGTDWLTPGTAGTPDVNTKLWNGLATVALPLVPTTAGRTLDVSATGEAGLDWANIGSPTTVANLSGTTVGTVTSGGGLDAAGTRAALGMAAADLDTQLDAILAASGGGGAVPTATIVSPLAAGGDAYIIGGYDYTVASGQPLEWLITNSPYDLTGALSVDIVSRDPGSMDASLGFTVTVINAGLTTQTVRAEITAAQSAALNSTNYTIRKGIRIKATLSDGSVVAVVNATLNIT